MAAGDFGSALAVGAFGLQKDVAAAEVYLRVGADGGDAGNQLNLGLLLLELGRAAEGAEMLRRAAEGGDESAAATCDQLLSEAKARERRRRSSSCGLPTSTSTEDKQMTREC